jgi:chromosomal replication initiation ATPase DnaA
MSTQEITGSVWFANRLEPVHSQLPPRVAEIVARVATEHGITEQALLSASHARPIAHARFDAAHRIRALTMADGRPPSYPRIARWLRFRDHTSALHACRRYAELNGL